MLHRRAKAYGISPSEIFEIEDDYSAYCFDEAIEVFGTMVDGLLKEMESTGSGTDKKLVHKYKTIESAIRAAVRLGSDVKVSPISQLLERTGDVVNEP